MRQLTSALIIAVLASAAHAELTPKSHIGIAGIDFQSQLGVDYGHDDNVTYQRDSDAAIDSNFW
ncbi:MAG: capsular biosynthesis protein, partial [Vibrio fluvialis]